MDLRELVRDYLTKAQIMQIATVHDHQPWVATVYFATDIDLNLYWMSRASRRHSQEILENPKVDGNYKVAALCIIISLVLDFLDGFVARALKANSNLGAQLDSLADM